MMPEHAAIVLACNSAQGRRLYKSEFLISAFNSTQLQWIQLEFIETR